MDDLDFPSLNTVTLVGRVKHRWDPKSDKAPLKLVVTTYKVIRDGRKIPRSDVVVLWGDFLKDKARDAVEGAVVSLTASIDSSKDKDGNYKDELRCETIGPVSGGMGSRPSGGNGAQQGGGYSYGGGGGAGRGGESLQDETIPFAPPGLF